MENFEIYRTEDSPILAELHDLLGFVPNVFAVLGENQQALQAFANMNGFFAESHLSPIEQEIVQTATSVMNHCGYCVAGHTAFAEMRNLEADPIQAIRNREPIEDEKLEALRCFVEAIVETKGRNAHAELMRFKAAGYDHHQVFDVILGVTMKMFSNLISGVTDIPLDKPFVPFEWAPRSAVAA